METSKIIIEAIGYLGSALVLVSFLMVSVFKLRVVNSIGSIIFTVYAVIIHSYPTAVMNACLVMINVYYLIKMSKANDKVYDFVKAEVQDSIIKYVIDKNRADIEKCFPGIDLSLPGANCCYAVCHEGQPVGIMVGKKDGNKMDILLDYSLPAYRDFSIGKFLFSELPSEGFKTLTYSGPDANHKPYLEKTGFVSKDGYYEKVL